MNSSSLIKCNTPNHYPPVTIHTSEKLQPQDLIFLKLNSTIDLATWKLVSGYWSEIEVFSWYGASGVFPGSERTIKHANNIQVWLYYQIVDGINNKDYGYWDKIYTDIKVNKKKYEISKGDPYWNGIIPLNQFVDAIIHLLFLGITNSSCHLINVWITEISSIKGFDALSTDLFGTIVDMGFNWCTLLTTHYSGWICESYLAFSRVVKWCYYYITAL